MHCRMPVFVKISNVKVSRYYHIYLPDYQDIKLISEIELSADANGIERCPSLFCLVLPLIECMQVERVVSALQC